jgi:hypothetical protein
MNTYMIVGTLATPDGDMKWIHQVIKAPSIQAAINSYETDGWYWQRGQVAAYRMDEAMLAKIPVACGVPFGQQPQPRQLRMKI